MSQLSVANQLARDRNWKDALSLYIEIWRSHQALRSTIQFNIELVTKHLELVGNEVEFIKEARSLVDPPLRFLRPHLSSQREHFTQTSLKSDVAIMRPNAVDSRRRIGAKRDSFFSALADRLQVDQIYCVSLPRRQDRLIRVLREMNSQGISFCRVPGVDGKFSLAALERWKEFRACPSGTGAESIQHVPPAVIARWKTELTPGVFGYLLSQASVFQDAINADYRRILVFDDDVFFCSEASARLHEVADGLPKDFKVLMLGASEYAKAETKQQSKQRALLNYCYHAIPEKTCGSFAVIYDQSVYRDLLDLINEAEGPFDNACLGTIYSRYPTNCFVVDPAVCIPDVGESDIRSNTRDQSLQSSKMGWETDRYAEFTRPFFITIIVNTFETLTYLANLRTNLGSQVILNLYFLSEDGLRPIIPGHLFRPIDKKPLEVSARDGATLRKYSDSMRIPFSDILLVWPRNRDITQDAVLTFVGDALQRENLSDATEGNIDGTPYCFRTGEKSHLGRHSIIIPCARAPDVAWPSVRSALLQDAVDFEVLVVCDNPNHSNYEADFLAKVSDLAEEVQDSSLLKKIRILSHTKKRNAAAARNTGILNSTGSYISFLDDDDIYEKKRCSAIEKVLRTHSANIGAAYCGYDGTWMGRRDNLRFKSGNLLEQVLMVKYAQHYMCTNTVTFKRNSLQVLGGYNEGYLRHQDLELMTRFFQYFKISTVNEFLVKNRPTPVDETFVFTIQDLCRLKLQYLRDMRRIIISQFEPAGVVKAHLLDIQKRDREMGEEMIKLIESFLYEIFAETQ